MSFYLKNFSGNTDFQLKKNSFSKISQYLQILILRIFNRQFCFFLLDAVLCTFLKIRTMLLSMSFLKILG